MDGAERRGVLHKADVTADHDLRPRLRAGADPEVAIDCAAELGAEVETRAAANKLRVEFAPRPRPAPNKSPAPPLTNSASNSRRARSGSRSRSVSTSSAVTGSGRISSVGASSAMHVVGVPQFLVKRS